MHLHPVLPSLGDTFYIKCPGPEEQLPKGPDGRSLQWQGAALFVSRRGSEAAKKGRPLASAQKAAWGRSWRELGSPEGSLVLGKLPLQADSSERNQDT